MAGLPIGRATSFPLQQQAALALEQPLGPANPSLAHARSRAHSSAYASRPPGRVPSDPSVPSGPVLAPLLWPGLLCSALLSALLLVRPPGYGHALPPQAHGCFLGTVASLTLSSFLDVPLSLFPPSLTGHYIIDNNG